ncbi:MAG: hypothetical protein JJ970_09290 [Erythrobacter sp.]|nr:hypothetical protein [Erythrobacter sp.]
MTRLTLHIMSPGQPRLTFETLNINTALSVIDINLRVGRAEIWDDQRCLARLRRCGHGAQRVWQVE